MRVQNGLGLKGFLSGRGCEYITTDKKEGPDNGGPHPRLCCTAHELIGCHRWQPWQPALPCPHCSAMLRRVMQSCSTLDTVRDMRADVDKLLPSTDILITTPFHPVRPVTCHDAASPLVEELKTRRMLACGYVHSDRHFWHGGTFMPR